jgi:hypothetical protein
LVPTPRPGGARAALILIFDIFIIVAVASVERSE